MDDNQLKNGYSMILNPLGNILIEYMNLSNDMTVVLYTREKLHLVGGHRYRKARRPQLYGDIIGQDHDPKLSVSWMKN